MKPQVSAYNWVPPFAVGYVRDLRVRWALEEAGLPYEARLVTHEEKTTPAYKAWQPFAQVPAYRDDAVEMFESGAIVLYLAEKSEALAPRDPRGRARAMSWVVAALNSVEPFMVQFLQCDDARGRGEAWAEAQHPVMLQALEARLSSVSDWLGAREHLEGRFSAGDLMMTCVLRELVECGVLARFPSLEALRARCEARPAFARAMQAQLADLGAPAPG